MKKNITFIDIKNSKEIKTYIKQADASLKAMGYTEHNFAHSTKCAEVAGNLLKIFLERMLLSQKAANFLGISFKLNINGSLIL